MGSIAVVIPTYNRLYALRETVPRYCDLPEVERMIVVDDASSDGTRRWLDDAASELDRLAVRRHDERRGSAASRNTGLRAARSLPVDRVLTVDDDILPGRPDAVVYDEGLGRSGYRDDTDFQLKAREAGFRLVVVPPAVMHGIRVPGDAEGCHSLGPLAYELEACRNNWRVLSRHREAVEEQTGRTIWLLQGSFVVYRLAVKLPARVVRRLRYRVSTRSGGR